MSLTPADVQATGRPAHVVAALRYSGASAVAFVDCVCGERVESIAAWYAHLRAEGQHPQLSKIGPAGAEPLRRLGTRGVARPSGAAARARSFVRPRF